ncbi:MAG: ABC transporter permease [Chloroflexota bacterium]
MVWTALLIAAAIRMTIPILLAALGTTFSERSGVVNIGIEGMMIAGTFWGAVGAYKGGPLLGFLLAVIAAMVFAAIHAVVTIRFKVDQVISGTAINILAAGLSRFFSIMIFHMATTSPQVKAFPTISIPLLKDIPGLGLMFRDLSPVILVAFALVPAAAYVLNRTVFGLRLRSVGENPLAADTLGINVNLMRYAGVIISGALAGLAGAFLAIEHTGVYLEGQTGGRGFIAMAAMIFGGWTPTGALAASLLFGLAQAVTLRVRIPGIPYQFIQMLPYLLTIAVLAGFVRKAVGPTASGVPYEREGE